MAGAVGNGFPAVLNIPFQFFVHHHGRLHLSNRLGTRSNELALCCSARATSIQQRLADCPRLYQTRRNDGCQRAIASFYGTIVKIGITSRNTCRSPYFTSPQSERPWAFAIDYQGATPCQHRRSIGTACAAFNATGPRGSWAGASSATVRNRCGRAARLQDPHRDVAAAVVILVFDAPETRSFPVFHEPNISVKVLFDGAAPNSR
jgi:hypothetical protein